MLFMKLFAVLPSLLSASVRLPGILALATFMASALGPLALLGKAPVLTGHFNEYATLQLIHAATGSGTEMVDVYVDGALWQNDIPYKSGSPFLYVPASMESTLVLAPSTSLSAADGFFSGTFTFVANSKNILVVAGDRLEAATPLQWMLRTDARSTSSDPQQSEFQLVHAAQDAPALDVVVRGGGMLVGNLAYGQETSYLSLEPTEIFLDVKSAGTTTIISTYRLSLQAETGQAFTVVAVGSTATASSLQMFIMYADGFSIPVDFAPVGRVQYINALRETVDVYKNGTRFADNAPPGAAMPFKYMPANMPMSIAIAPAASTNALTPYNVTPFTFGNMGTYTAVSAGKLDDAAFPIKMFLHTGSREVAAAADQVDFLFFQGDHRAAAFEVRNADGSVLFENVVYGTFSDYQSTAANLLGITLTDPVTGNAVASFPIIDLIPYKNQSLTLVAMPGINADDAPELWLAQAGGTSTQLSQSVSTVSPARLPVLELFPNPASSVLHVRAMASIPAEPGNYTIVDQLGRTILTGYTIPNGSALCSVDVSPLRPGAYALCLQYGHFYKSLNFIIAQ